MEQKFQKGYRVEIHSRNPTRTANRLYGGINDWENSHVGCEAIVVSSCFEATGRESTPIGYKTGHVYDLLIFTNEGNLKRLNWFEERHLELICCNTEKGIKIIEQYFNNLMPRRGA